MLVRGKGKEKVRANVDLKFESEEDLKNEEGEEDGNLVEEDNEENTILPTRILSRILISKRC